MGTKQEAESPGWEWGAASLDGRLPAWLPLWAPKSQGPQPPSMTSLHYHPVSGGWGGVRPSPLGRQAPSPHLWGTPPSRPGIKDRGVSPAAGVPGGWEAEPGREFFWPLGPVVFLAVAKLKGGDPTLRSLSSSLLVLKSGAGGLGTHQGPGLEHAWPHSRLAEGHRRYCPHFPGVKTEATASSQSGPAGLRALS